MKSKNQNIEKLYECANCNHQAIEGEWLNLDRYQLKPFIFDRDEYEFCLMGDHVRCPECNEIININYDLIDVDEPDSQESQHEELKTNSHENKC